VLASPIDAIHDLRPDDVRAAIMKYTGRQKQGANHSLNRVLPLVDTYRAEASEDEGRLEGIAS
jgi:hypothetical protein